MKITFDVNALTFGHSGTRTYLSQLLPALARCSADIRFNFVGDRLWKLDVTADRALAVWPPLRNLKTKLVWEMASFPISSLSLEADVIHIPFPTASVWGRQPIVMTVHDAMPWETPSSHRSERLHQLLVRQAARNARVVITVSEYSKRRIVEFIGIDPSRIVVTPLAADSSFSPMISRPELDAFKKKHDLEHPYILYIGGINERKGILNLIKSYRSLAADTRAAHDLVIVGRFDATVPHHRELLEQIRSPLSTGTIRNIVELDSGDLANAYRGATLFVFPSFAEGFGLPPLEAMTCGTPVIASNRTSMPEVVGDGGILVNPQSIDEIATAMSSVLEPVDLQKSLRRRGIELAVPLEGTRYHGITKIGTGIFNPLFNGPAAVIDLHNIHFEYGMRESSNGKAFRNSIVDRSAWHSGTVGSCLSSLRRPKVHEPRDYNPCPRISCSRSFFRAEWFRYGL